MLQVSDVGTQALSDLALSTHAEIAAAVRAMELPRFRKAATTFLSLINDTETLVSQQGSLEREGGRTSRFFASKRP